MEEILASIRRIISEGDEPSAADQDDARADAELQEAQPPDEPDEPAEEVLELTEVVGDEDSEERQREPTDFEVDLVEDVDETETGEADEELGAELAEQDMGDEGHASAPGRDLATTEDDDERLVSDDTAMASSDAFAELAQSVAAAEIRQDQSPRISHGGSDRTLEDVVREALRPLLKDWLDKNLPSLVHHLVKKEIERLSRR